MKQRYGPQGCYLLKINSRTLPAEQNEQIPDPWSQYLHRSDPESQVGPSIRRVRSFGPLVLIWWLVDRR